MQSARHTSSKSRSSLTPPLTRRHRREHMGCDIHLYREKRENGVWISADKWTAFDYGDDEKGVTVEYEDRAYTGENTWDVTFIFTARSVKTACGSALTSGLRSTMATTTRESRSNTRIVPTRDATTTSSRFWLGCAVATNRRTASRLADCRWS